MAKPRIPAPYARTLDTLKTGDLSSLSPQQVSDYARIAALPPALGRRLDRMGAPFYVLRWVAGPAAVRADLVEARFLAVEDLFRAGYTGSAFERLRREHARLRPSRGRARGVRRLLGVGSSFPGARVDHPTGAAGDRPG